MAMARPNDPQVRVYTTFAGAFTTLNSVHFCRDLYEKYVAPALKENMTEAERVQLMLHAIQQVEAKRGEPIIDIEALDFLHWLLVEKRAEVILIEKDIPAEDVRAFLLAMIEIGYKNDPIKAEALKSALGNIIIEHNEVDKKEAFKGIRYESKDQDEKGLTNELMPYYFDRTVDDYRGMTEEQIKSLPAYELGGRATDDNVQYGGDTRAHKEDIAYKKFVLKKHERQLSPAYTIIIEDNPHVAVNMENALRSLGRAVKLYHGWPGQNDFTRIKQDCQSRDVKVDATQAVETEDLESLKANLLEHQASIRGVINEILALGRKIEDLSPPLKKLLGQVKIVKSYDDLNSIYQNVSRILADLLAREERGALSTDIDFKEMNDDLISDWNEVANLIAGTKKEEILPKIQKRFYAMPNFNGEEEKLTEAEQEHKRIIREVKEEGGVQEEKLSIPETKTWHAPKQSIDHQIERRKLSFIGEARIRTASTVSSLIEGKTVESIPQMIPQAELSSLVARIAALREQLVKYRRQKDSDQYRKDQAGQLQSRLTSSLAILNNVQSSETKKLQAVIDAVAAIGEMSQDEMIFKKGKPQRGFSSIFSKGLWNIGRSENKRLVSLANIFLRCGLEDMRVASAKMLVDCRLPAYLSVLIKFLDESKGRLTENRDEFFKELDDFLAKTHETQGITAETLYAEADKLVIQRISTAIRNELNDKKSFGSRDMIALSTNKRWMDSLKKEIQSEVVGILSKSKPKPATEERACAVR